jgi:hypothetical protein
MRSGLFCRLENWMGLKYGKQCSHLNVMCDQLVHCVLNGAAFFNLWYQQFCLSQLVSGGGGFSSLYFVMQKLFWRMPSSGISHRLSLVTSDISEECSASFIRVTRNGELGTLAVTSNRRPFTEFCHNDMEELSPSETLVLTKATGRNIAEDGILHSHRHEHFNFF